MNNFPNQKNCRILVIDDNRAIHDDFRKILSPGTGMAPALEAAEAELFGPPADQVRQIRYEIDSAYQGQDGVLCAQQALAAGRPYAMAFVDIRMPPGMDGVETARKIWEVDPEIQIVLCTAYADYSWDEMFEKIGNTDGLVILKKPFDTVEALQLAQTLTEKWWLHRRSKAKMEELESMVATRTNELQRSNHTLQQQKTELRVLFDFLPAMICFKDTANGLLRVNKRLAEIAGKPVEEIEGKPASEIFPQDAEKYFADDLEVIRSGSPKLGIIETVQNRAGETLVIQTDKVPVFDEDRKVVGLIVMAQDITERKRAEAELNYERELLRTLMAHSPDKIYFKDTQSRFVKVSQAMANQFGAKIPEALVGKTDFDFFTDAHARPAFTDEQEIIRMGRPMIDKEEEETWKNGHVTWVASSKIPWQDAAGNIVGILGISRDITVRKKLEAQLFQSQKMETVGKLAGGIAHEFNSILTAILGQSELLLSDLPAGSPLTGNATEISRAASRAAGLTRQLLAYGRKQFLQPENLDLNRILAGMEGIIRQFTGANVDLRIVPAPGLHMVKVDAGQIEQVIVNIVLNACDAMPRGGKLTLETTDVLFDEESASQYPELKPGGYVMLAFTDTGAGMNEAVKARAFEPFFTTKGVGQGTGLGLATCYGIIKQSGGHISVYSEPEHGTTFKIYLPQVESPKPNPGPAPVAPGLPRGTETILLVEDDPALREMAATLLRRLGYQVLAAGNGTEALNLKQQPGTGHIDLLFTDIVMPHMSGKELADRVQMMCPHTKILFTSAYTENAIVHQGVLNKGVTMLQKPFTPSALAHKLREVLDAPGVV